MDSYSHNLFAEILLEKTNNNINLREWGSAPDIDLNFLHRWYRHRISTLPQIYKEFKKDSKDDKEVVALCVISHLYLDQFNSWVFPFGLWNPVYPQDGIINDIINDRNNINALIDDLTNLSGYNTFSDMFYKESEGIFEEFINDLSTCDTHVIIEIIVRRLAKDNDKIYLKAINNINKFTGNDNYIYSDELTNIFINLICEKFEENYIFLLSKATSTL